MLIETIIFILHGLLGAFLNVLIWAKKPEDLKEFETAKVYVIGAIAGYIYYLLYQNYSFPDSFMAVVFGYFAKDTIESLLERFKPSFR